MKIGKYSIERHDALNLVVEKEEIRIAKKDTKNLTASDEYMATIRVGYYSSLKDALAGILKDASLDSVEHDTAQEAVNSLKEVEASLLAHAQELTV